jgi:uracil-DNA glycosylase
MSMSETPMNKLEPSWLQRLEAEFTEPYMAKLRSFLVEEKKQHSIFPSGSQIFNAFAYTPFEQTRVVILGQDPYHGEGQAHGLCFSVRRGVRPPPSLQNIFKELHSDLGVPRPSHGELTHWCEQGVLLLNTVLTVRANQANSHRKRGWETFTDKVIEVLNTHRQGLVFVLWGSAAGRKAEMIDASRHLILHAPHPSPLSAYRGFMGCGHFSRINEHLKSMGTTAIDWKLPD